jgi:hypothetical protein
MDNNQLDAAADNATSYTTLVLKLFKELDANPLEALMATIIVTSIIARGLNIPREGLNEVITFTLDDSYKVDLPEGLVG